MVGAVKKFSPLYKLRNWYAKYERPISSLSLIGGFLFDAITLTQVDRFRENFWVAMHLLIVAVCIILINREENEGASSVGNSKNPEKLHFWLVNIMQFFFGGLLSTFIVFYFRSAVIAVTWPFFAILIVAFIANESFKRHYAKIGFQISFFFLSLYLFFIFLVPVLLHEIDRTVFLMSGGISLVVLILFLWVLKRFTNEGFKKGTQVLLSSVVGIYVLVNGLYFLHLIPPLPLSLQDAGVYHSISRTADGNYQVTEEGSTFFNSFMEFFSVYPTFHATPGEPVYAYSAIFSPDSFNLTIAHQWQYYDTAKNKWVTAITENLNISGGRDTGFRTYSIYTGVTAGKWRVNVTTADGQLIGRMVFNVVEGGAAPQLSIETKS